MPGIPLMARGLIEGTRLRVDIPPESGIWGRDTPECISAGIHGAVAALVERMVRAATGENGSPPSVVLTGGDADLVAPLLGMPVELRPGLVLEGLALWGGLDLPG